MGQPFCFRLFLTQNRKGNLLREADANVFSQREGQVAREQDLFNPYSCYLPPTPTSSMAFPENQHLIYVSNSSSIHNEKARTHLPRTHLSSQRRLICIVLDQRWRLGLTWNFNGPSPWGGVHERTLTCFLPPSSLTLLPPPLLLVMLQSCMLQ